VDPHDDMHNHQILLDATGIEPEVFSAEDMIKAMDVAVDFIDDQAMSIETLADRLSAWFLDSNYGKDLTIPQKTLSFRRTRMVIAFVLGFAMGKKAERTNVTLDKLLKGFKVKL
jgi:hypothetical protein